jgi:pantoate--beta-alanine ligase
MTILTILSDIRHQAANWRMAAERIALVPTMGALHDGHLTLIRAARKQADRVVVSIFVNPTQFAPHEDFDQYPRQLDKDATLAFAAGADAIYAPLADEIYPSGDVTRITVTGVSESMEGQFRPHFFTGVATVVARLLIHVCPDIALFGEKDFQQLQVIRRMVGDLALPVEIIGVETVREADGLAMSSRNVYLSQQERAVAPQIFQKLSNLATALQKGAAFSPRQATAIAGLEKVGFNRPDYLDFRQSDNLIALDRLGHQAARLLIAVRLGKTRLIDNIPVIPHHE